jgi:tetratricopeptide (TPR) repeat protein
LDRAEAFKGAHALDEAIADYSKAIEKGGKYYLQRGLAYDAKGDIAHAIEDYRKGLEMGGFYPDFYNHLARDLVKVGQPLEAERVIGKLIELRHASAFMTRAIIYEAMGRRDDALGDLRQALAIDPNLAEAREALQRNGANP